MENSETPTGISGQWNRLKQRLFPTHGSPPISPVEPASSVPQTVNAEAKTRNRTLEEMLSEMYEPDNFQKISPQTVQARGGAAAFLNTNETLKAETINLPQTPEGYLIGIGNGAIWSMLRFFKDASPKGVIAFDTDPSVILSGKVLVELAKKDVNRGEVMAYFYSGSSDSVFVPDPVPFQPGKSYKHTLDDLISLAREVADKETHPDLQKALQGTLDDGTFRKDIESLRSVFSSGSYAQPEDQGGHRGDQLNMAGVIYNNWERITKLAQEGKIFFAYSSIKNEETLKFVADKIPDSTSATNLIYCSNVADFRYADDLYELEMFNRNRQSAFVYTRTDLNYQLRMDNKAPSI